jgi:hypothetical protein
MGEFVLFCASLPITDFHYFDAVNGVACRLITSVREASKELSIDPVEEFGRLIALGH